MAAPISLCTKGEKCAVMQIFFGLKGQKSIADFHNNMEAVLYCSIERLNG
jgi:hypothetical protein